MPFIRSIGMSESPPAPMPGWVFTLTNLCAKQTLAMEEVALPGKTIDLSGAGHMLRLRQLMTP